MACREDTGLNNPLQKHKELDLLDVYFEWIILMPFLATSEANSAIFFKLVNQAAQWDLCTAFLLLNCKKEAVWNFE